MTISFIHYVSRTIDGISPNLYGYAIGTYVRAD